MRIFVNPRIPAGAQRTLYVTDAYFAPDDNFVDLLVRAARRGVDVRLLVGGSRTDVRLTWPAARARYATLLAAGVRIYEWQPSTLHAKTFVVDGVWSSIGTMNFDNRSLALNDEVALMVLDADVGRRMDALFLGDLRRAREVTAARFARRPWTARVAEWFADLLTRLLSRRRAAGAPQRRQPSVSATQYAAPFARMRWSSTNCGWCTIGVSPLPMKQ